MLGHFRKTSLFIFIFAFLNQNIFAQDYWGEETYSYGIHNSDYSFESNDFLFLGLGRINTSNDNSAELNNVQVGLGHEYSITDGFSMATILAAFWAGSKTTNQDTGASIHLRTYGTMLSQRLQLRYMNGIGIIQPFLEGSIGLGTAKSRKDDQAELFGKESHTGQFHEAALGINLIGLTGSFVTLKAGYRWWIIPGSDEKSNIQGSKLSNSSIMLGIGTTF